MNEVPPDQGEADEVDDLYRRASAADPSRPSESVRRAVLDHAAQLAAQRSIKTGPVDIDITRPAANQAWRRPAIFGTLAAAALAGFMIAPQFFSPSAPGTSALPPAEYTQPQSGAAPTAQAPPGASQVPAAEPALPPSQSNNQVAEMKADKRPVRSTARLAASPPVIPTDNGSADAQNLANVITTTQAQSTAKARSGANAQSAASVPRVATVPSATNAPAPAAASASEAADAKIDAQRMQSVGSSVSPLSAGRLQTAAPMSPAPRPADLSAELRHAAEIGDVPALQAVLGTQPAIDARDDGGRTALMLATIHGQSRAVEVLLASGADPNAADARGTTPLQAAEAGNQTAIADSLRRAGAR
jgi:Ankyrin repeats (many copies)